MSIGETLAEARHQAGLSVLQVSEQTRIRPTIIRGIEADDYLECGGDFYARGHIRSMAEVVGADPEPLIQEYNRAHRGPGPISATSLDELLASSRPERRRRPGWLLVLGLAAVVVLAFAGYHRWGSQPGTAGVSAADSHARHGQAASGPPGSPAAVGSARASAAPSPSAPARTPAPARARPRERTMAPVSAVAFGPSATGQGDDPQNARLAIDGNRGTAWHTDWYTTPRFGGLYAGTGLLLDMGHRVAITAVRVTLGPAAGARFQIRVGARPRLADLRPVARSAGSGGVVRLKLGSPANGRYVMVWFTRLPPDPAGTFQADVYGISVQGWR